MVVECVECYRMWKTSERCVLICNWALSGLCSEVACGCVCVCVCVCMCLARQGNNLSKLLMLFHRHLQRGEGGGGRGEMDKEWRGGEERAGEHTSELQSPVAISCGVLCVKKKYL